MAMRNRVDAAAAATALRLPRSVRLTLILREMRASGLATALSIAAVALAVAITVAVEITTQAMHNAIAGSEDAQAVMAGLLDQFGVTLDAVGLGIILASGFLIFNTFGMSVNRRRRRFSALRALGMTRRQVLSTLLLESLLLGGTGIALGWALAPLLGGGTIAVARAIMGESYFVFEPGPPSLVRMLGAAAFALAVTLLGALGPAWVATRVSPLEARRGEIAAGVEPARARWPILGTLLGIGLWTYLAWTVPGEWLRPPWADRVAIAMACLWLLALAMTLPALIALLGRQLRAPLSRLVGAAGLMIADNLRRARRRVTLTVISLAFAVAMVVGGIGFMQFTFHSLMLPKMERSAQLGAWVMAGYDFTQGMTGLQGIDQVVIPEEAISELELLVKDRATLTPWRFVIVPELSFFGSRYFSFLLDPNELQGTEDWLFTFNQGDWESARAIMSGGCGLLVTPNVAADLGAGLGDQVWVTGREGPVRCTIAGVGSTYVAATIIGTRELENFNVGPPLAVMLSPHPGVDRVTLESDLRDFDDRQERLSIDTIETMVETQSAIIAAMPNLVNALLGLAMVAAAMSVINTFAMAVAERRRELALLWAVGGTRRTLRTLVAGEAALIGLLGGGVGLVAGLGVTVIIPVVGGGSGWGLPDLDLWGAAQDALRPALISSLIGLALAPTLAVAAALLPARRVLRQVSVRGLTPEVN